MFDQLDNVAADVAAAAVEDLLGDVDGEAIFPAALRTWPGILHADPL
jgi:hypothetical protein